MSILFDGIDDVITCGAGDDILTENGALTISAWVRLTNGGENNFARIISKETNSSNVGVGLRHSNPANPRFRFFVFAGASSLSRESANDTLVYGVSQHVAVTWTGANDPTTIHIYINGVESASYPVSTTGTSPADNSTSTIRIGDSENSDGSFNGYIEEVALWNTVVAESDISLLSSGARGIPKLVSIANLKAYWPMNDKADGSSADGDTILDHSSIGRNGTGVDGANNSGLTWSSISAFVAIRNSMMMGVG